MWSAVRAVAARAGRASGSASANRLSSATSRVAINRVAPVGYRHTNHVRSFAEARGRPAKKTTATTKAKRATAGRKKPARKIAAKKKKAKPVKRVKRARKVLTPEEKRKAEIRELRKVALLQEPAKLPDRSWTVYVTSQIKGHKIGAGGLGATMPALSQSFRSLSSSEVQRLTDTAEKNKLANNATYKAWVESHSADIVADANKARSRLKRISQSRRGPIHDDRQPKRPATAYALFNKSRWASGDFNGQAVGAASKAMSSEWKNLSPTQRKAYVDLGRADVDRYEREMQHVLGRSISKSASP